MINTVSPKENNPHAIADRRKRIRILKIHDSLIGIEGKSGLMIRAGELFNSKTHEVSMKSRNGYTFIYLLRR